MSNTETIDNAQWADRELTEAQKDNRNAAALIPFTANGMSPQNFAQVVDFAKHMSHAKGMLGPHLVGNYAGCLAIIELAQQFNMRPFMLARQTYFVNGMIAFDGQAVMSIMNLHMPLAKDDAGNKTRLKYRFEGEHAQFGEPEEVDNIDERTGEVKGKTWQAKMLRPSTRKVIVSGRMEGEADVLEYESPTVFNIKNKKSPLWVEDEDQQLIYWASRRWQRRHWPEGMLGIIDREEAQMMHFGADNAKLIEASNDPGQAMIERIAAARVQTDDADHISHMEGFKEDHAHNETQPEHKKNTTRTATSDGEAASSIPADGKSKRKKKGNEKHPTSEETNGEVAGSVDAKSTTGPFKESGAGVGKLDQEPDHLVMPKNPVEWKVYCLAWIAALPVEELQKRWDSERKLRNDCGVVSGDERAEVFEKLNNRIHGE